MSSRLTHGCATQVTGLCPSKTFPLATSFRNPKVVADYVVVTGVPHTFVSPHDTTSSCEGANQQPRSLCFTTTLEYSSSCHINPHTIIAVGTLGEVESSHELGSLSPVMAGDVGISRSCREMVKLLLQTDHTETEATYPLCTMGPSGPTYLPTYLHTYLPTYPPTYLPTYIHTYLPTYLHRSCRSCAAAQLATTSAHYPKMCMHAVTS